MLCFLQSYLGVRSIATCLFLSSFGKSFALLHAIWDYPAPFVHAVELFVLTCNAVALKAQLRCSTWNAVLIVAMSTGARVAFELCFGSSFLSWERVGGLAS
jgi:hypothetical protein